MQRYELRNLPFFQEVREALENKCDCPHCLNKENQANNAAKRKFKVYPSAYANMYASGVCSGRIKPKKKNGKKRS